MNRAEAEQALDLLPSLMDKSLAVYEEGAQGRGRYPLAESGEADAVRGRN